MKKQRQSRSSRAVPSAVPVPTPARTSYPFDTMEVNHAFVVPKSQENSVRTGASRYKKRLGRNFTVRRLTAKEAEHFGKRGSDWVGVWRLPDSKA